MPANFPDLPPRYLRTPEAARFVGLSIRTLEKHRIYGTGPRYSKLGGRVVYRVEDLQAWVEFGRQGVDVRPWYRDRAAGEAASARAAGRRPFERGADLCQRRAASAPNAISSSSSGLCQAISRREMRRIS